MTHWFLSTFGCFLSWWGAFILAALKSSLLFVVPFGIEALVIFLAARLSNRGKSALWHLSRSGVV